MEIKTVTFFLDNTVYIFLNNVVHFIAALNFIYLFALQLQTRMVIR